MKYLRSTPLGCKDIGVRKSEFAAKTQFLYLSLDKGGIFDLLFYSMDYYDTSAFYLNKITRKNREDLIPEI